MFKKPFPFYGNIRENRVFARVFHVKKNNRGPKSLRDSELGFWGFAKRGLRKQEQPPPPYARARVSASFLAEYVNTYYFLVVLVLLSGFVSMCGRLMRVGAIHPRSMLGLWHK